MDSRRDTMFDKLPPEYTGATLAMIVAVLRVLYDKQETRPLRVILEALVCGGLSLTAFYGITAAGMSHNWAVFAGGAIGYLGSDTVRAVALRVLHSKTPK